MPYYTNLRPVLHNVKILSRMEDGHTAFTPTQPSWLDVPQADVCACLRAHPPYQCQDGGVLARKLTAQIGGEQ